MLVFLLLACLFGTIHAWCPDTNGVCTCSGECSSDVYRPTGTITCIIDGTLPSLQPGDSTGQGTCYWWTVNLIINSIPVLDSSIFNPGFTLGSLNIHQNSTDPIPFDTQPFMSNLKKDYYVSVTVTSLSGPLPFAAFDIDRSISLSFEGSFTIDKPLPLWKYPSSLYELFLNSSVYSELPSNVFENLQCLIYAIDIYNFTVIKSNMFNNIDWLQFCNVERIESFAVNNSNFDGLIVNRGYFAPCTKEASVSVIEADAFHNTKIEEMYITVSADSEIDDQWVDTQSIRERVDLDLKIKVETNNTIRCDSIGHLTKYSDYVPITVITVETSTPGLSISNGVCGNELDITYNGNCPDAECIVKLDQISSFPLVTQLRLSGSHESDIDINLTTHFPNLSQLEYEDVCDHSLFTLPSPSTIDLEYLDPSEAHPDPLHLVFRAEQLSMLNLTNILQSTQPINCSCSISWMIQLGDCHNNSGEHSVDKYLSHVACANQNSTVMEYLLSDTCCDSTEIPSPTPNCNGFQTLPSAVLTFDQRDLPQCRTNQKWRFDPCGVQSFYDNPLTTRQPPTTSTSSSTVPITTPTPRKHINLAYYLPVVIGLFLVAAIVSIIYAIRRRHRSGLTRRANNEVSSLSGPSQHGHHDQRPSYDDHRGDDNVVDYTPGRDYMLSSMGAAEYDDTLGNSNEVDYAPDRDYVHPPLRTTGQADSLDSDTSDHEYDQVPYDDMNTSTSNVDRNN